MIWAEDARVMTCINDPRCITNMKPSIETYDIELYRGEPMWGHFSDENRDMPRSKWVWTKEELDAIPEEERGVIPLYKLFTATWVSLLVSVERKRQPDERSHCSGVQSLVIVGFRSLPQAMSRSTL